MLVSIILPWLLLLKDHLEAHDVTLTLREANL